ncbi:MAG TPA: hypothetical protein VKB41_09200 [Steroidobacteraceae bacterium]|jgi:hypothetical protein|nr:hypothetical protein [Steroidobacteraceae bacterium]
MWTRSITLTALIGAALLTGQAFAEKAAPQSAIEASTANVTLPRTDGGSLLARGCVGCDPVLVQLGAGSRFFVGKQEVSLAELNAFLADGVTRGLTIMYDQKTRAVTRIVIHADLPKGTRK